MAFSRSRACLADQPSFCTNVRTLCWRRISTRAHSRSQGNRRRSPIQSRIFFRTPGDHAPYSIVKVSPDGTKAAVVLNVDVRVRPPNNDIWIVDLIKGGTTRLTFDPANDTQPAWSPDGKW